MKSNLHMKWLEPLHNRGDLLPIDVEFCRFLIQQEPGIARPVLLAAAITSKAYHEGNVCVMLGEYAGTDLFPNASADGSLQAPVLEEWIEVLRQSPVVGRSGTFRPLILDDADRLYLHRQWKNEQKLVRHIRDRAAATAAAPAHGTTAIPSLGESLRRLFPESRDETDWQKVAAAAAMHNRFTVISGGPGTGKTSTVVRILALLIAEAPPTTGLPAVALAAPTGKAAGRLEESIRQARETLPMDKEVRDAIPVSCVTIHQLLGARRHTSQFRYHKENPIPYDFVVVDEVSMVDQALMCSLMEALRPNTRLLLLGDKDQLSSVEAGSVLGELCGPGMHNTISVAMHRWLEELNIHVPAKHVTSDTKLLTDNIILLQKSYRFSAESGIGKLATAVNAGDHEEGLRILKDPGYPDATLIERTDYSSYLTLILEAIAARFREAESLDGPAALFELYSRFQILSPHRNGPWGTMQLNRRIEGALRREGVIPPYEQWYYGKPVIVRQNEYTMGLSNGDLGICLPDEQDRIMVWFMIDDTATPVSPARLPAHDTAYVMTVHKSQGSEFDAAWLLLPDQRSTILTRELIYTAVTRGRESVTISGSASVLREAIQQKRIRHSGLRDYLWSK